MDQFICYLLYVEHNDLVWVRADRHGRDVGDWDPVLDHHAVVLHKHQVLRAHHQELFYCLK